MANASTGSQSVISRLWPFNRLFYGWAIVLAGASSGFALVPTQGPVIGIFVNPITHDLGWPATAISIGFVLGTLSGGVLQWLLGGLFDKHGARWTTVGASFVVALAMVGLGLMTQAWQFWLFFAAARGFAAAGSQVGTMVALASWFVKKRGRVVGLVGMAQRGGQAVLPLPLLAIMAAFSWREAFYALGVLALVMAVIPNGIFMRRRPEDYGLLPDGERVTGGAEEYARRSESMEEIWTLAEAKRTRALWLLMVAQGGIVLSLNAVNLFITSNFEDRGLSDSLAVLAVTIFAAVSATSMMGWSILMERTHTRYIGLAVAAMFCVAMGIAYYASNFVMAMGFSVLYGLALGGWTLVSRMLFANYFGRRSFGTIRGFAAPFMVAANPLGPVLAGVIKDWTGTYNLAFAIFAVVLMVAFVAFLLAVPPTKARATA